MQHSGHSSYSCVAYLKDTKGVDLQSSHQASRIGGHTETEGECGVAGRLGDSVELRILSLCLAPRISSI